ELWHAALNSRGLFIPAADGKALVKAFQSILEDILNNTAKQQVSIAGSASRLRTGGFAYVASFNSERWSGELGAYGIAVGSNAVSTASTWKASSQLDAATFSVANRLVLTYRNDTNVGTAFEFDKLSDAQKAKIQGNDSAKVGASRVNYLRGDRSLEVQGAA